LQALSADLVSQARLEHTHDIWIGLDRDHIARQADQDRGIITMIGADIDGDLVAGAKPRQQSQLRLARSRIQVGTQPQQARI
jgi:hypothetical protein